MKSKTLKVTKIVFRHNSRTFSAYYESMEDLNVFRLERLVERAYKRMIATGLLHHMARHFQLVTALERLVPREKAKEVA